MDKTTSQTISDFTKFLSQATSDYAFSKEEVFRLEQMTQDYLHKIELQEGNYHEQASICYTTPTLIALGGPSRDPGRLPRLR